MANKGDGILKVLSLVGTLATAVVTVIGAVKDADNGVREFKNNSQNGKPDA